MEPNDLRQVGREYDLAMPEVRTLRALAEAISVLDADGDEFTVVSGSGEYGFTPADGCSCPDAEHNGRRCKHERAFTYRRDPTAAQDLQADLGTALLDVEDAIDDLEAELQRLRTAKWTLERHLDTAQTYPEPDRDPDTEPPHSATDDDTSPASVADGALSGQPVPGD